MIHDYPIMLHLVRRLAESLTSDAYARGEQLPEDVLRCHARLGSLIEKPLPPTYISFTTQGHQGGVRILKDFHIGWFFEELGGSYPARIDVVFILDLEKGLSEKIQVGGSPSVARTDHVDLYDMENWAQILAFSPGKFGEWRPKPSMMSRAGMQGVQKLLVDGIGQ